LSLLVDHDYPGNIRELENIIEQAFVLCRGGLIDVIHLPPELRRASGTAQETLGPMSLQAMEKRLIAETLWRCSGNRKQAARELGIDVSSLYRKIKAMQLEIPEKDGRSRKK
jgi:transcriptional regulator of acetoin/glycerol metabolism